MFYPLWDGFSFWGEEEEVNPTPHGATEPVLTHTQLKRRLRQLATEFDKPTPPPRGSITAAQERTLLRLIKAAGRTTYLECKANLGITATIPAMTSRQAYVLIAALIQATN